MVCWCRVRTVQIAWYVRRSSDHHQREAWTDGLTDIKDFSIFVATNDILLGELVSHQSTFPQTNPKRSRD
jgi:hypothetical protein